MSQGIAASPNENTEYMQITSEIDWSKVQELIELLVGLNDEQRRAFDAVVYRRQNVFITGSAGVGKSHVLNAIKLALELQGLSVSVAAPTAIAALNVQGVTLHSLLSIPPGWREIKNALDTLWNKRDLVRITQVLILDEISMLDGELLDLIEQKIREIREYNKSPNHPSKPFGGMYVAFVGDFYQLCPISKGNEKPKLCFEGNCWKPTLDSEHILTKVVRYSDKQFVSMLQNVRIGEKEQETRYMLRYATKHNVDANAVRLCASNRRVDRYNNLKYQGIPGKYRLYHSSKHYREIDGIVHIPLRWYVERMMQTTMSENEYQYLRAQIESTLRKDLDDSKVVEILRLKEGVQVMLTINLGANLVNGLRGKVVGFVEAAESPYENYKSYNLTFWQMHGYVGQGRKCKYPHWNCREKHGELPVVRFENGITSIIPPVSFPIYGPCGSCAHTIQVPLYRVRAPHRQGAQ